MTERNFNLIIKLEYEQTHGGGGKGKSIEDKPRAELNNIERGNNNNYKKGNDGGGGGNPAAKPTPTPRLNDAGQPMPSPNKARSMMVVDVSIVKRKAQHPPQPSPECPICASCHRSISHRLGRSKHCQEAPYCSPCSVAILPIWPGIL